MLKLEFQIGRDREQCHVVKLMADFQWRTLKYAGPVHKKHLISMETLHLDFLESFEIFIIQ